MKEQTLGGYVPTRKPQLYSLLPWAAPGLLWIGLFLTAIDGNPYDPRVYVAATLLGVTSLITYFRPEAGVLFTLPVVIAGILGVALFFPVQFTAGFELGLFNLTFDLYLILIAGVHFLLNREAFLPIRSEPTARQKERELRRAVAIYKQQFANMDMPELEYIAEDRRFLPAAVQAARELMQSLANEG